MLAGFFRSSGKGQEASQLQVVSFVRRHASSVLILVGALLLAYVGLQYGQMFWSQKRLQDEWIREQQRQTQQLRENDSDAARPVALKDDGLTRLSIPIISFDAVVVEGTSNRALLLGPGHLQDTPKPGDSGNSVISGHRDTFFRHIHELEKGDQILVQRNGKTFHYEVTGKHIVQPTDVSVLKPSKGAELTLITCYPTYYIGPAPERLVVTSKLIDDTTESSLSPATPVERSRPRAISH
jgi:LPXTG-site transpeptidase (sortase) family protein